MSTVDLLIEVGPNGVMPQYTTEHAAGMDLCASESVEMGPGERALVSTDLKMVIPIGYEGQVRPRSGLAIKKGIGLVNAPGTIDADYRGEIKVIMINWSTTVVQIEKGERIAQLVICPVEKATLRQIESVAAYETTRGEGGFGSTGS